MSRSKKPAIGTVLLSDAITADSVQLFTNDPDSKLVSVFLGTCAKGEDPQAAERLEALGWSRSTVFYLQVSYSRSDRYVAFSHHYLASSPKEATISAIRFAKKMLKYQQEQGHPESELNFLEVGTLVLSEISEDGNSGNKSKKLFAVWSRVSKQSFEEFCTKVEQQP